MADLANEGRGGAVGGQLAAREWAVGGPGARGRRGEYPGVPRAHLLRDRGAAGPADAPHCVPLGPTHWPGPSLAAAPTLPRSGRKAGEAAGAAALRPFRLADQSWG